MKKTMIGGALRRSASALACLAAGVLPAAAANEARPLEPGSEYLMVANYPNNLNVVDLASESVYKTCPLPDAFGPGTTQIAPDRRTAYILNNRFGTIYGIDIDTCRLTFRAEMSQGDNERAKSIASFTVSADGKEVYAVQTGSVISEAGIPVNILPKLASGQRPNVIDLMKNKDLALVINTPSGKNPREDEVKIRTAAMQNRIPIMTTLRGADAALRAIKSLQGSEVQVRALQEYHSLLRNVSLMAIATILLSLCVLTAALLAASVRPALWPACIALTMESALTVASGLNIASPSVLVTGCIHLAAGILMLRSACVIASARTVRCVFSLPSTGIAVLLLYATYLAVRLTGRFLLGKEITQFGRGRV